MYIIYMYINTKSDIYIYIYIYIQVFPIAYSLLAISYWLVPIEGRCVEHVLFCFAAHQDLEGQLWCMPVALPKTPTQPA